MTAAPIIRIVDDDPNIHDALAYVLENEGFIVRHYESAESFVDYLVRPLQRNSFSALPADTINDQYGGQRSSI